MWTSTSTVSHVDRSQFATIGRIIKTHGVKGEVSFAPADGLPLSCLEGLTVWIVPPAEKAESSVITSLRPGPKGPLIGLDGYETLEQASILTGKSLVASATELPAGSFKTPYDPVGVRVTDEKRGDLGTIAEVIVTGANDVWVVTGGPYGEVLIPVIDEVVLQLDHETDSARVRLLPGLIEEGE